MEKINPFFLFWTFYSFVPIKQWKKNPPPPIIFFTFVNSGGGVVYNPPPLNKKKLGRPWIRLLFFKFLIFLIFKRKNRKKKILFKIFKIEKKESAIQKKIKIRYLFLKMHFPNNFVHGSNCMMESKQLKTYSFYLSITKRTEFGNFDHAKSELYKKNTA